MSERKYFSRICVILTCEWDDVQGLFIFCWDFLLLDINTGDTAIFAVYWSTVSTNAHNNGLLQI